MTRRMLSLLLTLCLVCALSMTACAAEEAPAGAEITPEAEALAGDTAFSDVPADAWYAPAVEYCKSRGLMTGTSHSSFEPEGSLTRAMAVTVLHRAEGTPAPDAAPSFTDVPADAWYTQAVAWAASEGLVLGYGDGRFGPGDPVTLEQLAAILQRYGGGEAAAGVTDPTSKENATRAEVAAALYTLSTGESLRPEGGARVLVAYFSATGTTRAVAERIQAATGGDLFEIVPEVPYTSADLNYSDDACRANREQQDASARPAVAPDCTVENWADYDVVFLGHPIWWGIPPKILRTFAEGYDWSGKTVVGFCTSGGSGYSNEGLPELTEGAVWLEGRRLSGSADASEVLEWIESLPFPSGERAEMQKLQISFHGYTYTATLADNSSAAAFAELLEKNGGSITVSARDYGDFEKVGELPESLPRNDEPIEAAAGDLILYQGSSVVLYYDENAWTFTRLGRLEGDLTELKARLGEGDVEIVYTLLP